MMEKQRKKKKGLGERRGQKKGERIGEESD